MAALFPNNKRSSNDFLISYFSLQSDFSALHSASNNINDNLQAVKETGDNAIRLRELHLYDALDTVTMKNSSSCRSKWNSIIFYQDQVS